MHRILRMGSREEAQFDADLWDSPLRGNADREKRSQLERRLLLNMEVRKDYRHRRDMGDECGCGAGQECAIL